MLGVKERVVTAMGGEMVNGTDDMLGPIFCWISLPSGKFFSASLWSKQTMARLKIAIGETEGENEGGKGCDEVA